MHTATKSNQIMRFFYNKFSKHLLVFVILNAILCKQNISDCSSGSSSGGLVFAAQSNNSILPTEAAVTTIPLATQQTPLTPPPLRLPPPRVKLNKCCHYGEYLDATQTCVLGSSELWVPLIFLINRKIVYSPKGESPKFMIFEENVRPIMPTNAVLSANVEQESDCTPDDLELFTGSGNLIIFSNGSLFLREHAQFIEPRRYCVDRDAALVCFPRDKNAKARLKLKKCCGKNASYDAAAKMCSFPKSAMDMNVNLQLPINESIYKTVYGFPECHEASTAYAIASDWNSVDFQQETGVLQVQGKNLSTADYCLEHLYERNTDNTKPSVKVFTCLHHFANPEAPFNGLVASTGGSNSDRLQMAALHVGIVISVVFLAATLVAGYMMPSVHHVLHWRCQIYYVFCLFIGDLLLAYTQLSRSLQTESHAFCLLLASAMHFFFLAAFFWLNTMCFNIWWTFRDFRPSSLERNQELLRLRLYSAYAWGLPLLISGIAACVNMIPDSQMLSPGFGERGCWFNGEDLSIFAYFFGPVGILLCANIMLFISTTHQLTCGLWKRDDVKSTTEKTALGKVCLKLVVVMGVTWIADVISWLVGGPHSVWFFTDLINAFQGVFIFIVVGCQPQVWSACKRLCCPRSRHEITNTTNGVQHSSSQGMPSMAAYGGEITQNTSINTTIAGTASTQAKIPMETVC